MNIFRINKTSVLIATHTAALFLGIFSYKIIFTPGLVNVSNSNYSLIPSDKGKSFLIKRNGKDFITAQESSNYVTTVYIYGYKKPLLHLQLDCNNNIINPVSVIFNADGDSDASEQNVYQWTIGNKGDDDSIETGFKKVQKTHKQDKPSSPE